MANIVIDVAAEFTGKKAFDQAGKSTFNLEKNVKKLASAFGLAFSTQRVVAYGKASVKAFAEDNAAIIVLRKNLQNLGLAYESTNAETFIGNLEKQAGILDDELRPAYSKLAKVTLSAVKTQELMNLAVDLSRSTGLEFSAVINTLSRAYIGNYKGLKQLNIGLTDAELKTKDFAEIQEILIKQSKGAGKAYIETFAGSIDKLAVASANAKEVIGEGLVDLFADLAGNGDINKATDNINTLATAVSDLLKDVDKLTLLDYLGVFLTGSITKETFDKLNKTPGGGFTDSQNAARLEAEKKAKADAKAAAARLKTEKALAAARIAADKKAAANRLLLAKAESIFDIEKIQIEAALKGKISEDEKLRLQLQRAILNEDFELANKLQKQLESSQRATAALQSQLTAIKPAANPFEEWIKSLEEISESLTKILGMPTMIDPGRKGGGILALEPDDLLAPKPKVTETPAITEPVPVIVIPSPTPVPATNGSMAGLGGATGGFGFSLPNYLTVPPPVTVIVNNTGTTIMQEEFVNAVADALVIANTEGKVVTRPGGLGFTVDEG